MPARSCTRLRAQTRATDLVGFLSALNTFLVVSPAGLAYRALLGEAQHDPEVRALLADAVVLSPPVHELLVRLRPGLPAMPPIGAGHGRGCRPGPRRGS